MTITALAASISMNGPITIVLPDKLNGQLGTQPKGFNSLDSFPASQIRYHQSLGEGQKERERICG